MVKNHFITILLLLSLLGFLIYVLWSVILIFSRKKIIKPKLTNVSNYKMYIMIPFLNEKYVVADTIEKFFNEVDLAARFLENHTPSVHLIAIDDDSDDGTSEILDQIANQYKERLHILHRVKPNAQQGKGEALNHALKYIKAREPDDREHVLVGILDADAFMRGKDFYKITCLFNQRMSFDMIQITVAMNNVSQWMYLMQDMEFRSCNYLIQNLRNHFGNSAASGNGQFFRLSALTIRKKAKRIRPGQMSSQYSLKDQTPNGGQPISSQQKRLKKIDIWGNALLEDFESSIRLLLDGQKTYYYADAIVYQEPVDSIKILIRQRVRWCQGGIQCIQKYLKKIFDSSRIKLAAKIEIAFYMFLPFITAIVAFGHLTSVIYQVYLLIYSDQKLNIVLIIFWFVSMFISFIIGLYYGKRCESNLIKAGIQGLTIPIYNLMMIPVVYLSFYNILKKNNKWVKTTHLNTNT